MKIVTLNGSPNKNGSTSELLKTIEEELISLNHEVNRYDLYDYTFKSCLGCFACSKPETKYCAQNDDMIPILEKIDFSDALVFGTPVYFGHIPGVAKSMIDRFYTLLASKDKATRWKNKIFANVITQGGEIQYFENVRTYFQDWFIDYFGMKQGGTMVVAELSSAEDLQKQPESFQKAKEIAKGIHIAFLEKG